MTRWAICALLVAALAGCGDSTDPAAEPIGSLAECEQQVSDYLADDPEMAKGGEHINLRDVEAQIARACGNANPRATVGNVAGKVRRWHRGLRTAYERLFE